MGMSQAQLAYPELSDSYVSLIESGRRIPTPEVVSLLAGKLGCSTSYLVNGVSDEVLTDIRMTLQYAQIALQNGEPIEALDQFGKVVSHAEIASFPELRREAAWGHARAQEAGGRLEDAVTELEGLAATIRPDDHADLWAQLHMALCRCYRERGDFKGAAAAGEEGLRRLTDASGPWTESMVMLGATLLTVFYEQGDLTYAQQFADRLVRRAEEVGSSTARAAAYWNAGSIADFRGDPVKALHLAERAFALLGEGDDVRNIARLRSECGRLLLRAFPEQAERARDLLQQSREQVTVSAISSIDDARFMTDIARSEILLDRPEVAISLTKEALTKLGDEPRFATADALIVLANGCVRLGQVSEARVALKRAAEQLESMESSQQASQAWLDLAELLGRAGATEEQAAAYRRAMNCAGI
jgi:tetratricopeptide (TPR) repeat protein